MNLKEALNIEPGEVISLVGAGGKTTLMFALAREFVACGESVVTTTTTKILYPSPGETPLVIVEADEERLLNAFLRSVNRYRHVTLARERLSADKLNGVSQELIIKLAGITPESYIIVEADGAARKPLKAPNLTEPVIPPNTSLVIPVVGVDALGLTLTTENVFRAEIAAELLGLTIGEVIKPEAVAKLITHPRGMFKDIPTGARVVPFLNKVDLDGGLSKARELADRIIEIDHAQIGQVILGHANLPNPVVEVFRKG
jgi:probable selenium-dependent hydroxylase accessory protein YqeC